jgi:hypothetical protein
VLKPKPAPIKYSPAGVRDIPDEIRDHQRDFHHGKPPTISPTMGITIDPPAPVEFAKMIIHPEPTPPAKHKLVVIGDSLSHGFKHGAVHDTRLSWGAILATELGASFRTPFFNYGDGMPINIEALSRAMGLTIDPSMPILKLPKAYLTLRNQMSTTYQAWTRGAARLAPFTPTPGVTIDNLAQFGFDILDAMQRTELTERGRIKPDHSNLLAPMIPSAGLVSSAKVLSHVHDAGGNPISFTAGAELLGRDGGIETLVVALGANNALGAVEHLDIRWSGPGYDDLDHKDAFNVWRPQDFRATYAQLVQQIKGINAQRVVLCTVPHVTVAPVVHGIGGKAHDGSRYFQAYTRPWVTEETFNPAVDPHLTTEEARDIDSAIDRYNLYIEDVVQQARTEGRDWMVLDLAGILDRLATRRYIEDPAARPEWWSPAELPEPLAALNLDTRFFKSVPDPSAPGGGRRTEGGWIGLDGIHPNTVGYAYVAWHVANLLQQSGVHFPNREADGTVAFDWQRWIDADSMMAAPPANVSAIVRRIGQANELYDAVRHPIATTEFVSVAPGSARTFGR